MVSQKFYPSIPFWPMNRLAWGMKSRHNSRMFQRFWEQLWLQQNTMRKTKLCPEPVPLYPGGHSESAPLTPALGLLDKIQGVQLHLNFTDTFSRISMSHAILGCMGLKLKVIAYHKHKCNWAVCILICSIGNPVLGMASEAVGMDPWA